MSFIFLILAAWGEPSLIDRFQSMAHAEQQAGTCGHLDRSPATLARAKQARQAAAALTVPTKAPSAAGKRAWAAMKDGIDDSCIVGPGETNRSRYRDMISHYERTTRETAVAIPKGR